MSLNVGVGREGSSLARIGHVFGKEIVDTLRDRRTIAISLFTAVVAGPVLLLLVLNMAASQSERARALKLPIEGLARAPGLADFLSRHDVFPIVAPPDYEARIRAGELDVVVVVDEAYASDVAAGRSAGVRIVADRSRDRARSSVARTEALVRAYARQWGNERLLLRGIAKDVGQPLDIESVDLATPQQAGSIVLFLVAFYGLFATLMGGIASAIDVTAGERERGSLEPLLATPLRPFEIALGKWLAIAAFAGIVLACTVGGFYATLRYAPLPAIGVPFLFGARELGRFMIILAPLVALMPAELLYVGFRGRTLKEAQANISMLMFVMSMVPAVQLFLQQKDPPWLAFVPVAGQYALLSRALRGDAIAVSELLDASAVPLALAALAIVAAARLLRREAVLGAH